MVIIFWNICISKEAEEEKVIIENVIKIEVNIITIQMRRISIWRDKARRKKKKKNELNRNILSIN